MIQKLTMLTMRAMPIGETIVIADEGHTPQTISANATRLPGDYVQQTAYLVFPGSSPTIERVIILQRVA